MDQPEDTELQLEKRAASRAGALLGALSCNSKIRPCSLYSALCFYLSVSDLSRNQLLLFLIELCKNTACSRNRAAVRQAAIAMSREEVQAFLVNLQLSLDNFQKTIDQSLKQLPALRKEELPKFLAEQKDKWLALQEEQAEEWSKFLEDTGLDMDEAAPGCSEAPDTDTTPFNVKLKSLEQRVAAMGGRPALGSVVLPKMTPAHKAGLQVTSSPAAVEILRGKLGSDADAHTPLRKSSSEEAEHAATPLVELCKTNFAERSNGFAAVSPNGAAPPASELASAIQRRAQRQLQQQQLEEDPLNVT